MIIMKPFDSNLIFLTVLDFAAFLKVFFLHRKNRKTVVASWLKFLFLFGGMKCLFMYLIPKISKANRNNSITCYLS